jgi:hypothetical protein
MGNWRKNLKSEISSNRDELVPEYQYNKTMCFRVCRRLESFYADRKKQVHHTGKFDHRWLIMNGDTISGCPYFYVIVDPTIQQFGMNKESVKVLVSGDVNFKAYMKYSEVPWDRPTILESLRNKFVVFSENYVKGNNVL